MKLPTGTGALAGICIAQVITVGTGMTAPEIAAGILIGSVIMWMFVAYEDIINKYG